MNQFELLFRPSVEKDLRRIPSSQVERLLAQTQRLTSEPFPRQSIKLTDSNNLYRLRVGVYRIIYGVDSTKRQIIIHHIRHRSKAYQ